MNTPPNDADHSSLEIELAPATLEAAKITAMAAGLSLEAWVEAVVRNELKKVNSHCD